MTALSAVAAIVLGGAGLAAAAFPERASGVCDRLLRAIAALVFGLGAWSAGYAASLLAFGAAESVRAVKDVAIALCGVALLAMRRRPAGSQAVGDEAPRWLIAIFAVACCVFCLVFIEHSIRAPEGGFDAWMLWNSRARFLARAGDDFRVAFSPRLLFWTHQDYPWLLPGLVAQWFLIARTESPVIPAVLGFVFGAATIAIVSCSLARLRGAQAALVGGLAVASLPCFAAFDASQQADVPLAAFVALAAALVAMAVEDPRRPLRPLLLAGFAAGLGAWTKNDGLVYLISLAAALLLCLRDVRAAAIFLLGSVPALALLFAFRLGLSPPNDFLLFTTRADLVARFVDARRWVDVIRFALRQVVGGGAGDRHPSEPARGSGAVRAGRLGAAGALLLRGDLRPPATLLEVDVLELRLKTVRADVAGGRRGARRGCPLEAGCHRSRTSRTRCPEAADRGSVAARRCPRRSRPKQRRTRCDRISAATTVRGTRQRATSSPRRAGIGAALRAAARAAR